ncbi:unnamed protein product [Camellia sinensis]
MPFAPFHTQSLTQSLSLSLSNMAAQNSKLKCFSGILRCLFCIGSLPTQPSDPTTDISTTDIPTTTTTFENKKKNFKAQVKTRVVARLRKVFRRKEQKETGSVSVFTSGNRHCSYSSGTTEEEEDWFSWTFGQVLECLDNERKEIVAIKIVRSINKYREAAMIEIDVLQKLSRHDIGGTRYGFNGLNRYLRSLDQAYTIFCAKTAIVHFQLILFGSLANNFFMHDLRLIHTDLKPENILLVSSEYVNVPDYKIANILTICNNLPKLSVIKLIDFGSTTFEHEDHTYVVSTRQYRAPEVILGLGWNYPCDLWSVGCILVELCSGETLFEAHENLEHLAMTERVLGPLPHHMIISADLGAEKYFKRSARLDWPEGASSKESMRAVWKLPRLQNLIMEHVDHSAGDMIDLWQGLLRYDPAERLTARETLRHPFFTGEMRSCGYPF